MSANPGALAEKAPAEPAANTPPPTPPLGLNRDYIRTIPGILKIAECILCIVVFICIATNVILDFTGVGRYTNFSAGFSLTCSFILGIFFLTNLIYKLPGPWLLIRLAAQLLSVIFFFIALCLCGGQTSVAEVRGSAIASSIFTGLAVVAYIGDAFLTFMEFRRNDGSWQQSPPRA